MVATYLFVNDLTRRTIPNSVIINLWILVAVSSVVAAKAITSTAISVLASSREIPSDSSSAPPPSTKAVALFALACAQES